MPAEVLSPAAACAAIAAGARLVDVRQSAEHARERIEGAQCVPLERIGELASDGRPIVFHCRSGMRTAANAPRLVEAAESSQVFLLDGGIDAWRSAGLPTLKDRSQPIEVMRQVQIAAGLLVMLGIALGAFVAPAFFALSAFVGGGLLFAGVTGWCGMANLLRVMPWNRRVAD